LRRLTEIPTCVGATGGWTNTPEKLRDGHLKRLKTQVNLRPASFGTQLAYALADPDTEQLGKHPDTVATALNMLLDERKVQKASLGGYWKLERIKDQQRGEDLPVLRL
jgi:hypothetical protein